MKPPTGEEMVPLMRSLLERLGRRRGVRHVALGACTLDGLWEWVGACGTADRAGTPMGADTPWLIASVTKLYVVAVVLRLHEAGRLRVDEPAVKYLPGEFLTGLHVLEGTDFTDEITAVQLLGHLSGLPDYLTEKPAGGQSLIDEVIAGPDRSWTPAGAVRRARDRLSPYFRPSAPGSTRPKIRYSDTNYQLLVVMAEHVTGKPMATLYQEMLFEPLALGDTWLPGARSAGSVPAPATVWLGPRPFDDRPLALASVGDLYSTTHDLLRFGRGLFAGEVFEHPRTLGLMSERFNRFGFPRRLSNVRAPSWPIEYGLGLMRFELGRLLAGGLRLPPLMGHTGSTGSWLWYLPDHGALVAGTVDQATGAAVPFRAVPRALSSLT